jgi:S1-C subfamily serine protease
LPGHHDWLRRPIEIAASVNDLGDTVLQPAGRIEGQVVNTQTGKPIAGRRIIAQAVAGSLPAEFYPSDGDAITNDDGRYEIGGLPSASFNVMFVGNRDDLRLTAPAIEAVKVVEQRAAEANLSVRRGQRLFGRVLEANTGKPAAGVHVGYYGAARPETSAAILGCRTKEDGSYEFFVPPGMSRVYISDGSRGPAAESDRRVNVTGEGPVGPIDLRAGELGKGTIPLESPSPEAKSTETSNQKAKVEQIWADAIFWKRKGNEKAARIYCQRIVDEYPKSEFAERAGRLLAEPEGQPVEFNEGKRDGVTVELTLPTDASSPLNSIVGVKAVSPKRGPSNGSGVTIRSDGKHTVILTCHHLFPDQQRVFIRRFSGDESSDIEAKVIRIEEADLAILAFDTERRLTPATFNFPSELAVGQLTLVAGCRRADGQHIASGGQIQKLNFFVGPDNLCATPVVETGFSGGGLFNEQGELIGICHAIDKEHRWTVYSGPKSIQQIIEQLDAHTVETGSTASKTSAVELADEKQSRGDVNERIIPGEVLGPSGPINGAKVTVTLSVSGEEKPDPTDLGPGKDLKQLVYTTDAEGRYRIVVPADLNQNPALRLEVHVEHPGMLARSIGPLPVSDFDGKEIGNDQAYWLHRDMARQAIAKTRIREGKLLGGRVLLPNGTPTVGAKVWAQTKYQAYSWKFYSADDYTYSATAITDEKGRFTLLTDRQTWMTVELSGQAPLVIDDLEKYGLLVQGDPPNTFRLPMAIRPRGRVLTADGKPIARAIVVVERDVKWNEIDMPLSLSRKCAADENGEYQLPPLPVGDFRFKVNSRLADASQADEFNQVNQVGERPSMVSTAARRKTPAGAGQSQFAVEPLRDVFLVVRKTIGDIDDAPKLDFRAVESVGVTARIEFPDGKPPEDSRSVDLTVTGKWNNEPWSGVSATADENGIAKLSVPRGISDALVGTGLARHRQTPEGPVEIGDAIHLGHVSNDVSGLVVIRPQLATLKVKLNLPDGLADKCWRSQAFIRINAVHARKGYVNSSTSDRRVVPLSGSMQTGSTEYRGTALPDEELVLRVTKSVNKVDTVLHEERLTLSPGEERLRTIDIVDKPAGETVEPFPRPERDDRE